MCFHLLFTYYSCIKILHANLAPSWLCRYHKKIQFVHFRILALEKLGAVFNQVSHPLQHTPRKFVIHPETNNLIVIETDYNAYTEATKMERKQQMAEVGLGSSSLILW